MSLQSLRNFSIPDDTKLEQIIWKSDSKEQNESLIERLNSGYGFNGKIPSFFNNLQEG